MISAIIANVSHFRHSSYTCSPFFRLFRTFKAENLVDFSEVFGVKSLSWGGRHVCIQLPRTRDLIGWWPLPPEIVSFPATRGNLNLHVIRRFAPQLLSSVAYTSSMGRSRNYWIDPKTNEYGLKDQQFDPWGRLSSHTPFIFTNQTRQLASNIF